MPRLSIIHPTGWNESFDFCQRCYPNMRHAAIMFNAPLGDVDMDNEHPPYSDDAYRCESCGRALVDWDN